MVGHGGIPSIGDQAERKNGQTVDLFKTIMKLKIKKDSEAKKALKSILRSIRKYSDATKITKPKFWSTDIGTSFSPKKSTYITAVVITIIVVPLLFYVKYIDIDNLQQIGLLR